MKNEADDYINTKIAEGVAMLVLAVILAVMVIAGYAVYKKAVYAYNKSPTLQNIVTTPSKIYDELKQ